MGKEQEASGMVVKGVVILIIAFGMVALWFARSGSLPMSAYRAGQFVYLPLIAIVAFLGMRQMYLGLNSLQTPVRSQSAPAERQEFPNCQWLTDEEAAALGPDVSTQSPFALGTALPLDLVGQEVDFEAGVLRETALGSVLAAFLMVAFGGGALAIFPVGAVMISGLGGVLGAFGLTSRRPYLSLTATFLNLCVLVGGLIFTLA